MGATLVCDDVVHWAQTIPPIGAHALLCHAPYELNFMGSGKKDWWDNTGIAFRPETWKALAQHLLPGAFGMTFGSSRGWHRLACAIEDAGLILHPSVFLLGWANGSGFPKATRVDDERFDGHRYGLQALKPALEPILVWQKPYQGKPVESITATGAGALWIEGTRVPMTGRAPVREMYRRGVREHWRFAGTGEPSLAGRWPANLALCHTEQCMPVGPQRVRGTNIPGPGVRSVGYSGRVGAQGPMQSYAAPDGTETVQAWTCAEDCPVAALDAQAGERKTGVITETNGSQSKFGGATYANDACSVSMRAFPSGYGDSGPASRFFYTADWSLDVAEQLAQASPVFYAAKASRRERDAGLEGMPIHDVTRYHAMTTQGPLPQQTPRLASRQGNPHPTVKPLSLVQWLATLLLPPAAYAPRRLLIPFAGSGSECIGAMRAGWDDVVGIEQEPDYVRLAQHRLAWWTGYTVPPCAPPEQGESSRPAVARAAQLSLF